MDGLGVEREAVDRGLGGHAGGVVQDRRPQAHVQGLAGGGVAAHVGHVAADRQVVDAPRGQDLGQGGAGERSRQGLVHERVGGAPGDLGAQLERGRARLWSRGGKAMGRTPEKYSSCTSITMRAVAVIGSSWPTPRKTCTVQWVGSRGTGKGRRGETSPTSRRHRALVPSAVMLGWTIDDHRRATAEGMSARHRIEATLAAFGELDDPAVLIGGPLVEYARARPTASMPAAPTTCRCSACPTW